MEKEYLISSESEMLALGERIGTLLPTPCFLALYGDLGAGKSVLARGIAKTFGIDSLPSPTFTIVQEYPSDPPFFHFDVYRLSDEEELWAIGYADYLARDAVLVMEWADLVSGCLPSDRMDITIRRVDINSRLVTISSAGKLYDRIIELL